ncbi:MAG: hypothetical protein HY599_01525 [Candidatus Omnitrophica bacterium]|nr:hypothetical protein [Candidatus Omnitrophota bacterium]
MQQRLRVVCRALVLSALSLGLPAAGSASGVAERLRKPAAVQPASGEEDFAAGAGHVQVRGEWFYVDGEPFLVKGIGYSPYRPGQVPWRDQVELSVMERDFQRIAEAGFNTLRTWSPLRPEAVDLAGRYGLMVLQGIWVERSGNYTSQEFREAMLQIVRREVGRVKGRNNVLAFLVGNEILPEVVFQTGIPAVESLLQQAAEVVKAEDPGRLVSYANWPSLSFLNTSIWDFVGFNLYPYEPSSVSHAFGFRGYVEHLRQAAARGKPLVITETGLSVSPNSFTSKAGYGGLSPAIQREQLLQLWDDVFQAGAQGGVIFEWNDEWWKNAESTGDEATHDDADPEEWFGLLEFSPQDQREGRPRVAYEALKAYNQAILLSPVSHEWYEARLPVTVYATGRVARIRARVNRDKWLEVVRLSPHWWKALLALPSSAGSGEHRLTVEAFDAKRRLLTRIERTVTIGPPQPPVRLTLTTDRSAYEASEALEPVRYTIAVTDTQGRPIPSWPVDWSVAEPQTKVDLTLTKATDAEGRITGTYLVHEPGIVLLSAATRADGEDTPRRVGAETFILVRQLPSLAHQPSPWERDLPPDVHKALRHAQPAFQLSDPGSERVIAYERYGKFLDAGTPRYRYDVRDWEGLAAAAGEGVYPNEGGVLRDPAYKAAKKSGRLEGSHWDFTWHDDIQLGFFKWAQAEEEVGVKQFYTALLLERAGQLAQAAKAYHAVLVHFPTSIGWTGFDPPTPYYVGKTARDKLEALLRLHPELGLRLEDAQVLVEDGFDNDVDNDRISIDPGRLVRVAPEAVNPPSVDVTALKVTRQLGKGTVRLVQYENGHWRLLVHGTPWIVQGMAYMPSAVGETPDEGSLRDWMTADRNANKRQDVFESFVDANRNNRQDAGEPAVGDFVMLRDMGVNTLRLFHTNHDPKTAKPLLRRLHQDHGFMVMMGDFVGMYTIGSGASWEEGTNYLDKVQRKRMSESVKRMVREYKDEPYLLMWVLGNENNYGGMHGIVGGVGNAGKYPAEYYQFINELTNWIHAADPNHPVVLGNGEWMFLDVIAKQAPAIDIFGANVYRGPHGFGRSLFEAVRQYLDRPVLITEYGCPAYQLKKPRETAERDQALYHFGNWVDLADNMAGRGTGNVIGAATFEWSDEWWKAGQPPRFSPKAQETHANWPGPFPGGFMFEEWLGLVSQGDGRLSPFLRQPRTGYRLYQQLWGSSNTASH